MKVTRPLLDGIVVKQLKCFVYIERMREDGCSKYVLTWYPIARKKGTGRPKSTTMEFL